MATQRKRQQRLPQKRQARRQQPQRLPKMRLQMRQASTRRAPRAPNTMGKLTNFMVDAGTLAVTAGVVTSIAGIASNMNKP